MSVNVVPAHLDFLAIYNPSLGTTDETLDQQIVYFSSSESRTKSSRAHRSTVGRRDHVSREANNERLRQIGLAQGMVEFAKTFADGKPVDTIETEKSRIILHELEAGWWILASISLTQFPVNTKNPKPTKDGNDALIPAIEYSSREVKPCALLLQDLLRAHSTFLLHHASSMSALFVRTRRPKFVGIVERYWDSYLTVWNVMLHGNPAVTIYGGIKLAASGELGIGVGEEDRGSGEREVLEGFVSRVDGMVDLIVSRFGDAGPGEEAEKDSKQSIAQAGMHPVQPWLGTGAEPSIEDGAIFLGTGALSRKSLRDVTHWMEDLYSWGPQAYGVLVNPTSTRKARRPRRGSSASANALHATTAKSNDLPLQSPGNLKVQVPPGSHSESKPGENSSRNSTDTTVTKRSKGPSSKQSRPNVDRRISTQSASSGHSKASITTTRADKFVSFLKMGYGTHWSLGGSSLPGDSTANPASAEIEVPSGIPGKVTDLVPKEVETSIDSKPTGRALFESTPYPPDDSVGHFMVGLIGDLEEEDEGEESSTRTMIGPGSMKTTEERTLLRTVTVELEREQDARAEANISIDFGHDDGRALSSIGSSSHQSQHTNQSNGSYESQDRNKTKKLRVVVYAKRPFIYVFLFELRTESLAFSALYKSLHHQLGPLQRSLLSSTQYVLSRPEMSTTTGDNSSAPIYDLIWDPKQLTVTSTIPNIPEPVLREAGDRGWSRIEALSTHNQILTNFAGTRNDRLELERTLKTSRGWWVVWARILDQQEPAKSAPKVPGSDGGATPLSNDRIPVLRAEASIDTKEAGSRSRFTSSSRQASMVQSSEYSGPAHPFMDTPWAPEWSPKDKEIILIRKSSDNSSGKSAGVVGGTASYIGLGDGWGSAPAKLAQGIGVDTKRYIEGLLNMGK